MTRLTDAALAEITNDIDHAHYHSKAELRDKGNALLAHITAERDAHKAELAKMHEALREVIARCLAVPEVYDPEGPLHAQCDNALSEIHNIAKDAVAAPKASP